MGKTTQYLISKDNGKLQIPYGEYIILMKKAEEAKRIHQVKNTVLASLEAFLGGSSYASAADVEDDLSVDLDTDETEEPAAVEAEADHEETIRTEKAEVEPTVAKQKAATAKSRDIADKVEIPPIKKEIAEHFNKLDESGRLLNVFRQYYACINDACGGTVRVTMKDGFCSLWNYDEWEEFAFVDIFEGNLRFAIDPRYTDTLSALSLCEVPRLLSSRRSLVCVQVGDLNNTMLNVLAKAFEEVGLTAS